jgi:hypothetical protein
VGVVGHDLARAAETLKRIFSAARPWWVGMTCSEREQLGTASRKRYHDGEPA